MRTAITTALLVVSSPLFIYMSCKDAGSSQPCDKVICTMEFRTISVRVTDNNGNIVKLDEAYTERVKTGERITSDVSAASQGSYIVLDDGYQKKLAQSTAEFRFVGIKGGKQVINESYMISADCCHINKESGKTEVVAQ